MYMIAACMMLVACSSSKSHGELNDDKATRNETTNGKYFYVDDSGCVHANLDCMVFLLDSGNYAVIRKLRYKLNPDSLQRFCSHCVSDGDYEKIIGNDTIRGSVLHYR